jgi:hypothetical protein
MTSTFSHARKSQVTNIPPAGLSLKMQRTDERHSLQLQLRRYNEVLASIAIPKEVTDADFVTANESALWTHGGEAAAVSIKVGHKTFMVLFKRSIEGEYLAVDISAVERHCITELNWVKSKIVRAVSAPIELFFHKENGRVAVLVRTRAWDATGQRYTVKQPLAIGNDGKLFWQ